MSGGGGDVNFESMSIATRPVSPKAVVWRRPGRCVRAHVKISSGESGVKCAFIAERVSSESGSSSGWEKVESAIISLSNGIKGQRSSAFLNYSTVVENKQGSGAS